jgi:hypothetical protein
MVKYVSHSVDHGNTSHRYFSGPKAAKNSSSSVGFLPRVLMAHFGYPEPKFCWTPTGLMVIRHPSSISAFFSFKQFDHCLAHNRGGDGLRVYKRGVMDLELLL